MVKIPKWFVICYKNQDNKLVSSNSEDGMVYNWNDAVIEYEKISGYKEIRSYDPESSNIGEIVTFKY